MKKYKVPAIPQSIWQKPSHFIAFGFGSGALPFAPGTFGTLVAIPFYLILSRFNLTIYFIALAIITFLSIQLCERVSKDIQVNDHQGMCLDEIVGFLFAMIAVPSHFLLILTGFLLFRLFDIWKPWPIRWVDQHIHGGLGMILDDVLAGILSCVILHGLMKIFY